MQSNAKSWLNLTGYTVLHSTGTATGPGRTDVNNGAILRAAGTGNIFGGNLRLGGTGSGPPTGPGGILEITSAAHDFDGKAIEMRGGGFAAVGADVDLSLTNITYPGSGIPSGNDGGGPTFGSPNATHTLTFHNDILRANQASYVTTIDGPAEIEAILTGELARGDRMEFRGTGAVEIQGKISSRDDIEVNGGTVILAPSAQTANQSGTVQNKTFRIHDATGFGADDPAALLLTGAQTRANNVRVRTSSAAPASIGGYDGTNSWTGTITLEKEVNLHAEKPTAQVTFEGDITGNGNVHKTGPGTVVLSASSYSYNGYTYVEEGTLVVDPSVTSTATHRVLVRGNAYTDPDPSTLVMNANLDTLEADVRQGVLMGNGTLLIDEIAYDGAIAPGTGVGNLTARGLFPLRGAYLWELGSLTDNGTGGTPGSDWDLLTLNAGAVIMDSSSLVDIAGLGPSADPFWGDPRTWTIITGGPIAFTASAVTGYDESLGTFDLALSPSGEDLLLSWSPAGGPAIIPEPATFVVWLLLAAAGLAEGWRRRKC
jgi:autotransporter-associated beta strand protein